MARKTWRPAFRNLKYFCWLRLLVLWDLTCGFYIKVTSNPLISFITRIYCLTIVFALSAIGIIRYVDGMISPKHFYLYTLPFLTQSCILAVSSQVTKQEYYFRFCADMKTIDFLLGMKTNTKKSYLMRFIMVYTGVNVLMIVSGSINYADLYDWVSSFSGILNMTHQQISTSIVDLLWRRMRLLREVTVQKLKAHQHPHHIHHKFIAIKMFMHVYKNLLDAVDRIGTFQAIQLPMLLYLIFGVVTKSFAFPLVVSEMETQEFSVTSVFMLAVYAITAALAFTPVFLAECVYAECDHIITALADQILQSADEPRYRGVVVEALQYVEARRPERALGSVLPFDSRLPLRLIVFITSFTIVLLQFNYIV